MATTLKLTHEDQTSPITLEHLCNAVDAVPGARIGPFGHRALSLNTASVTAELQLGVEVYDPESEAWRLLVTFLDGVASVEREDIEGQAACHAVEQIMRILRACLVTEEGVVLVWGRGRDSDA